MQITNEKKEDFFARFSFYNKPNFKLTDQMTYTKHFSLQNAILVLVLECIKQCNWKTCIDLLLTCVTIFI